MTWASKRKQGCEHVFKAECSGDEMSARPNSRRRSLGTRGDRQGAHVTEMQRRRLTHAVVEVVGEHGLEAATVGRVCGQAGVSRRTFYELFADREECVLAGFDAEVQRLGEHIRAAVEGTGRWRERLRSALEILLEELDAQPEIARFCMIETARAGPRVLERRRHALDALAVAVDAGRDEARSGSQPPALTAQGVVAGAVSVIHARLSEPTGEISPRPLVELTGPLMAMIIHPYLGTTAARSELELPAPRTPQRTRRSEADPFRGLPIRFTYRTALVLGTIAEDPGASNRHVADRAGILDEGQVSRLLRRLQDCELIENHGNGHARGEPNAWTLTQRGHAIHTAIHTTPQPTNN
jgi:AcrR family transcriptional regulator